MGVGGWSNKKSAYLYKVLCLNIETSGKFLTSESSFYDSLMSHVTRHPKKVVKMLAIARTCEIVRGIKILNNTTQYCLILHSIAQYCPIFFDIVQYCQILSSYVQYCPALLYIIRLAILTFFHSSFYNVKSDSIKHCPILSSISSISMSIKSLTCRCHNLDYAFDFKTFFEGDKQFLMSKSSFYNSVMSVCHQDASDL